LYLPLELLPFLDFPDLDFPLKNGFMPRPPHLAAHDPDGKAEDFDFPVLLDFPDATLEDFAVLPVADAAVDPLIMVEDSAGSFPRRRITLLRTLVSSLF